MRGGSGDCSPALCSRQRSALWRIDRISGFGPGVHAPRDVIDVLVPEAGQCFGGDVAPVTGLTIHDNMIVELCTDFHVAAAHLPKVDIVIGAGNEARHVFISGADVNQNKPFLLEAWGFLESSVQLLDGQHVRLLSRDGTIQYNQHK